MPMTSTLKNFILDKHNQFRQQIASGSNSKFPSAKDMHVMQWDDTLQFLAETHVSHCSFQHDQCRATPDYPYAGQNLYYKATSQANPNATAAVESGLNSWFNEWTIADPNIVDSIQWEMWRAFHFSVMVHDQNNNVGCGLLKYNYMSGSYEMNSYMLTCDYGYTNMLNEPMYLTGTPCSECTCSTTYPALCETQAVAITTTASPTTTSTSAPTTTTTSTTPVPTTSTTPASTTTTPVPSTSTTQANTCNL